ncbi:MAG: hypothetical protein ACREXP_21400 [Steroidobacteraceae bacterium]
MIVGSGAARAIVNAVLKSGKDKMSSRALIDGISRAAIVWATATGVTIATYTVIDAQGVRAAASAQSYIAWIQMAMMPLPR